jgi:omega-6 fatty acid desaturase (delta-12 desaturase)
MCKNTSKPQPLSTKVINATNEDRVWKSKYNPLDPKAPTLPSKGEIKAVIPKECFERSLVHSMYFVFRDSVMAAALVYATSQVLDTSLPDLTNAAEVAKWVIGWNFYAFWMGTILTGHWVLAHECGHGAFSSSQTINDIVGFIIHQAQLVPYFAWQYTHAKHHRRTNHLTDGESHVPGTASENGLGKNKEREAAYAALHEAVGDGAFAFVQLFTHLVIGWPLYLAGFASTGRLAYDGSEAEEGEFLDHFRPNSRMFNPKVRGKILLSTIGEIFVFGVNEMFIGVWLLNCWFMVLGSIHVD